MSHGRNVTAILAALLVIGGVMAFILLRNSGTGSDSAGSAASAAARSAGGGGGGGGGAASGGKAVERSGGAGSGGAADDRRSGAGTAGTTGTTGTGSAPSARRREGDKDELRRVIRKGGGGDDEVPQGKLTPKAIRQAIRAVIPHVRKCYETRLKKSEALQGRIVASFVIVAKDGQGHIKEGEIASATSKGSATGTANPGTGAMETDLRLQSCVLSAITKAKFPMPEGEKGSVRVRYPFKFSKK
ncbi:MAG: hypothetical protein KC503_37795 [Myxococcales bacterium]|nr:hypothetical protein [Myxococcales bacterium]